MHALRAVLASVIAVSGMSAYTYRRPPLVKYQLDAIFCPERYAIIEASTKSGKTHGCICWLTEQAMLHGAPGRNFWWVAPVYPQAEIAYRRLKLAIPQVWRTEFRFNDSSLTATCPNQALMVFKSGEKPDNLYGEDVYAGVADEATRTREEAWHALRSTLTKTRGPLRIIANVKGRRNWVYNLARRAEAGEPDMHYAKITAADAVAAGILDAAEIEDARRQLPEQVFRELYLAEPSDDGGNPFGMAHIAACVSPLSASPAIVYGVDLAKSVDYTWIIGLDASGAVCHLSRFQSPWDETLKRVLAETSTAPTLVDSTGVGDPIVEGLQRARPGRYEGYKFTSESKQRLMEGLAVAIQKSAVRFPDGPLRQELEAYEYEYTRTGVRYSAPAGLHDDGVCALALAWSHYTAHAGRKPASVWGSGKGAAPAPSWYRS